MLIAARGDKMAFDFDQMNETDVREAIVRPLLNKLGYEIGTNANLRTEVPLRYARAFLGRKDPKKDPPLAGRADYVCDAVSYGRWVVEVKAPSAPLSQDDAEQAHTYCAHPDIAASHFLLSNGRQFRLYATSHLAQPLLEWSYEETEDRILNLMNIVGYDAIKRRHAASKIDPDKPLGLGINSSVEIIAGEIHYHEHISNHPLFQADVLNGTVGTLPGGEVKRADDGRIYAKISVRTPFQQLAALNKFFGMDEIDFYSSDEYISNNVESPTVFQNVTEIDVPPGVPVSLILGTSPIPSPIGFKCICFSEAVGFVEDDVFQGVANFHYDYDLRTGDEGINPALLNFIANMPRQMTIEGAGTFKVRFR